MEKRYVLTLRDCPKSVNHMGGGARAHWSVAAKEKKRWEGLYSMELLAARVPRHMLSCEIDIIVRWKHRNRRDIENYRHPITKPLLDALVKGAWLPDDTADEVTIRNVSFEYPDVWAYPRDPRIKSELTIVIDATYR